MMITRVPTLSAFGLIPFAVAWGNNLTGLLETLNANGLDRFSNATASLNGTTVGNEVLTRLSQGTNTIFAPSDNALSGIAPGAINESLLADIVAYHIVSGNFVNQTQTFPNVTIGRTLLNDSSLVTLEGNQSQVLVWSKSDNGTLFVMNQGSNITVVNSTSFNDTAILAIDSVLTPPPNISTVLNNSTNNLTLLAAFLQSNGSSTLEALNSAHGITVFAPNNAAVQAAQTSLASLSRNATALQALLSNHVINGTSVYSTEFSTSNNYTSAAGQNLTFATNSTGLFVSAGGTNQAQIVEPNVLVSNGVIHIINAVMVDTNSNVAAASSAFASATSVAGHASEAGPVTVTSTPSHVPSPTQTSSPTSGGVAKRGAYNWVGSLVAMVIGLGQFV